MFALASTASATASLRVYANTFSAPQTTSDPCIIAPTTCQQPAGDPKLSTVEPTGPPADVTAVSEPNALALFGLSLVLLGVVRRRK
jgi:PEP-CTERM motif